MRALTRLSLPVALALALGMDGPSAAACETVGQIQFICGVISPEDLAVVPGSEWVVASGNQEGGAIQLVSVRDKTVDGFAAATTAVQVGNEIWLGTNRGEMIAYFPAP